MERSSTIARDAYDILAQTLEQAIDGVVVIDEHNCVTMFNAAAEALWGLRRDAVLGRNVSMLVPETLRTAHDGFIEQNRRTGINRIVGTSRDVPIERPDGTRRWASMSISRIRAGGRTFYTAFLKDVTAQRARDELLRQLQIAVNESDSAMIVTRADGRVAYVNAGVKRMLGYELVDLDGRLATDVLTGPHTDPATRLRIRALAEDARPGARKRDQVDILLYTKGGRPVWVSATVNPVFDAANQLTNYIATLVDITQTKLYELLQHKALAAIARETPLVEVMALVCREVERLAPELVAAVFAVDALHRLRPLAGPSLPPSALAAVDGVTIGPESGGFGAAAYHGTPVFISPIRDDRRAARFLDAFEPLMFNASWSVPLKKSDGGVVGVISYYYREAARPSTLHQQMMDTCVDVCTVLLEREESRSFLRALTTHDPLTGLPNGGELATIADAAFGVADRTRQPLAVIFVNIDRFKQINDLHGYPIGNGLLKVLARRLAGLAGERGSVARLTGDEFVVLLPGDVIMAAAMAERINALTSQTLQVEGRVNLRIGLRIGIAMFPHDGVTLDVLLRHADMATRQVERGGRGGFCFYSASMNRDAHERLMLEHGLREALRDDGLALHYQPQLEVASQALHGVEALLRWRHRLLGDVSPLRFVLLAEECGLIDELGAWVLDRACRQLADWRARGVPVPRVAVNLSPLTFRDATLPARVTSVLAKYGLRVPDLVLEMTEGAMLATDDATLRCIETLNRQGVRLSIDDFGTGYSSLSYLHRLPIHEVKLDKSFVQDLEHSAAARALTTSVLRIGESLGMQVVAEGVETAAQFDFLSEQGCPLVQGYLFARPLPPAQLEAWIQARAAR